MTESPFSVFKRWLRNRKLPQEVRPGASHVHKIAEKSKLRNQTAVTAADELAKLINSMADTGKYPILTKWLSGGQAKMK